MLLRDIFSVNMYGMPECRPPSTKARFAGTSWPVLHAFVAPRIHTVPCMNLDESRAKKRWRIQGQDGKRPCPGSAILESIASAYLRKRSLIFVKCAYTSVISSFGARGDFA